MKVAKRRRREAKTNYSKRIKLLKGNAPRVVFRKTNKYVIAQYIVSKEAKDNIEVGVNSKALLKYGWPKQAVSGLKSLSASYLTGYLMGKKIEGKAVPIIDFGMIINLHKTKIYSFLKGLSDSGVKIKFNEEKDLFPSEERIKGEHLKNKIGFDEIKKKIAEAGASEDKKIINKVKSATESKVEQSSKKDEKLTVKKITANESEQVNIGGSK